MMNLWVFLFIATFLIVLCESFMVNSFHEAETALRSTTISRSTIYHKSPQIWPIVRLLMRQQLHKWQN